MYSSKASAHQSGATAGASRPIPHHRIDEEELIYKKYELGRKLGQGSFGLVHEVVNRETNQKFAMKTIYKEKAGIKGTVSFENEVSIMKSVTHQNLIRLEEVYETKKKLFIITELCEFGELAKWLRKQGAMPEDKSRIIMRQIVDAISYLHKNDIVHRDLKLENILVKEYNLDHNYFDIKVTDFGLSSQRETVGTESMFEDFCGTPLYMAPEIIENYPYSQLCDVWALGIIMFFILTGHFPFHADNETKLREQIRKAEIQVTAEYYTRLSPEAKDCLQRMMRVNPANRITSSELIDHAWFLGKKLDEVAKPQTVLELMNEYLLEQDNSKKPLHSVSTDSSSVPVRKNTATGEKGSEIRPNENNSNKASGSSTRSYTIPARSTHSKVSVSKSTADNNSKADSKLTRLSFTNRKTK